MADVKLTTTTRKEYTCTLSKQELIAFLTGRCNRLPYDLKPEHTRIFVRVPGGGDWSSTDLEIDDADGVVVSWYELETK